MREFFVWAPHADAVALVRFPTGSEDESATEMQRGDDGVWRIEADAPEGEEYLFRIASPAGTHDRLDPRARQVTNSVGRSVVRDPIDGRDALVARPLNEWVIYELHPGTFGGNLDGVIERLDALTDLGITVVEVMPVNEFAGDLSWGYNPSLPFAIESSYGGPDALRRLVTACHQRGIAVVIDVVYNHLGPSDLDLWRFDGWSEPDGGGIYFYNDWRAATPWGATRPDYGRAEVRGYLLDNARMWFAEYGVDGLRLDSTVNIRNAHGHDGEYGELPEAIDFLRELTDTVHREFPGAVLIAEDLQDNPMLTTPTGEGGLGFDLQWAAGFVHPVRAALTALHDEERDVDAVAGAVAHPEAGRRVVYTESHDEVANGSTRIPAEIDPEAPDSAHALRRAALGAALMMAAPGVPMLFQGQEWADEEWFDDARPLAWERREQRPGLVGMWRDLVALRTGADDRAPGLRGDQVSVDRPHDRVLVIRRWGIGGPESATITVVNLGADDVEHVSLDTSGQLTCVFSSDYAGYHGTGTDASGLHEGGCHISGYAALLLSPTDG